MEQTTDAVTVTAETPGGEVQLGGDWLVGADGGRSAVRKSVDVLFEGFTWPERFVVIGTTHDYAPHGYTPNAYVADPEEWAALFKMPDDGPPGLWRLALPVPPEEDEAVTLHDTKVEARLQHLLSRPTPYPVKHTGIYKVHQRVAREFRVGRVLLAGDAAHINNPLGAFGLNGGIHDAVNLAGKLGPVCRGEAELSRLDRYVRQRRAVNLEYVQEASIRNLRRLAAKTDDERQRNFDELRRTAAEPDSTRQFLLVSSMIASIRQAEAIA